MNNNPFAPQNAQRFLRLMVTTAFILIVLYVLFFPFLAGKATAPAVGKTSLDQALEAESDLLRAYREKKLERANKAAELSAAEDEMLEKKKAIEANRQKVDAAINEGLPEEFQKVERIVPVQESVKN